MFYFRKTWTKNYSDKKTQPPAQCFWCISKQEKIKWEHSQSMQSYFMFLYNEKYIYSGIQNTLFLSNEFLGALSFKKEKTEKIRTQTCNHIFFS